MNQRLSILQSALTASEQLLARYPENNALQSINVQLKYLMSVASGEESDRSRLKEIIIGVLTAREIESLDEDAAELFYKAADEARRM
ncbi:immunity protein Tsi6 family protein [Paraburkholderia sp. MM5482-R1]|uniref:immunity protein Tsi6 family protein n=1 Tax=unclassified Paraburkholderia TaxID=2615204 RepID=UPI003D1CBB32